MKHTFWCIEHGKFLGRGWCAHCKACKLASDATRIGKRWTRKEYEEHQAKVGGRVVRLHDGSPRLHPLLASRFRRRRISSPAQYLPIKFKVNVAGKQGLIENESKAEKKIEKVLSRIKELRSLVLKADAEIKDLEARKSIYQAELDSIGALLSGIKLDITGG